MSKNVTLKVTYSVTVYLYIKENNLIKKKRNKGDNLKNIIDFNTTLESFKQRLKSGFTKIPSSIRYDKEINDSQKILYAVLVLLNNTYDYVYASNEYLSLLLDIPKTTLRDNLYILRSSKYIFVKDSDLYRYIQVRKNDLNIYQDKIDIDASSLDFQNLANYYSLIPGYVLLSDVLNSSEKILYAEIMALTNKYGFAFISNTNLAKTMNISERQLIRCLKSLLTHGFIKYGKDIKSKRLIYVTYHYKKEFNLIDKSKYKYQVIESSNNSFETIRKSISTRTHTTKEIDDALDRLYKNIK